VIAYRLCKADHSALDGEGARLWGGRWNSAGRPMVYAAASPSLAVLEVLVHLDLPVELLPDGLRLLTIDIPDDVAMRTLDPSLIEDDKCRTAGDGFLDAGDALALLVGSVIVPKERNVLLNVRHADMMRVTVQDSTSFQFDSRLLS
jgi:RES domain-containing protein